LLVYALMQRQARLSLRHHQQYLPGNKGVTAMPTAAGILAFFAQVMMGHVAVDNITVLQVYGWQEHHKLVCDALGIDRSWYEAPASRQNSS
jgi:hypothetical protein